MKFPIKKSRRPVTGRIGIRSDSMFDFLSLVKGLGLLLILEGLWWLAVGTPIWLWIKNRKKSGED
jgi:hypothetical protein